MKSMKGSSGSPTLTGRSTTRHRTRLAAIAVAAACCFALALGPAAHAGTPTPPVDLLPDIDQSAPSDISTENFASKWHIVFGSEIYNRGTGALRIRGARDDTSTETMAVTQIIDQSDATTRDQPLTSVLKFVPFNHNHWHMLDLEHYELRSLGDPNTIVTDHKTGFCMADLSPDNCGMNDPTRAGQGNPVNEGIRVSTGPLNGYDYYLPVYEGQYVDIDPVTTPAGRYDLTHRSNTDQVLLESSYDNNAASVEIQLDWASSGTPSIAVVGSCPNSATCGTPPQPQQPETTPTSEQQPTTETPAAQPEPVAPPMTVQQTTFGPKYLMTRKDAGRLAREAIRRAQKTSPRGLRLTCSRRGALRFACEGRWRARGKRWTGHVGVWERVIGTQLVWFSNVSAQSGDERVRAHRTRGGARIAWASFSRDLVCHGARQSSPLQPARVRAQ